MAGQTRIEWTECTWNPVTGCTKISEGCRNCYAERMAKRLQAMGQPNYAKGFALTVHPGLLDAPKRWHKPQLVFVNSMSDLFHPAVPDEFIHRVFGVMNQTQRHQFQVLTKRSERLAKMSDELTWSENIWMGVSVETDAFVHRIDDLRDTPASIKFVSAEPLLASLGRVDLSEIDWVIVGGESGPHARPMKECWALEIRDACMEAGVPFFFKQWGGTRKHVTGRLLEGRTWDAMPHLAGTSP